MQNRILASIISAIAYICLNAAGAHAQKDVRRVPFAVAVDSVEWRDDLTRVYCRITGHPHTSGRIDAVAMDIPGARGSHVASDIDGVDFRRYFQWEDDGVIVLEIDFPPAGGKP